MGKASDLSYVQKAVLTYFVSRESLKKNIAQEAGCSQSAVSKYLAGKALGRAICGRKRCTQRELTMPLREPSTEAGLTMSQRSIRSDWRLELLHQWPERTGVLKRWATSAKYRVRSHCSMSGNAKSDWSW